MTCLYAIALNTVRELMRSRILLLVLFFVALLVVVSTLFGTVTIGEQEKVIAHFGLFGASFGSALFISIAGTSLLQKELSRKTIYNILGKSVRRYEFLVGKFFGLLYTAAVVVLLMTLALALYLMLFTGRFDALLFVAAAFFLCELIVLSAVCIFFSALVVTPFLSGSLTFVAFLVGRSADWLLTLSSSEGVAPVVSVLCRAAYNLVPHLYQMAVADEIVYGLTPSLPHLLWSICYATGYATALLALGSVVFNRRDFN